LGQFFSSYPEIWSITLLSLEVSGAGLLLGSLLGIPVGVWMGFRRFVGRRFVVALLYTGMGLPPVVVGLAVYLMLSRSGPLGVVGWLFTPQAMVIAQTVIAFPLIAGLTMVALLDVNPQLRLQVLSLGASPWQASATILWEARLGVIAGLVAGFGAIISEVGAVMIVGGNIEGSTRVLTTAIILETRQGDFQVALALSLILLSVTLAINVIMLRLQGKTLE